MPQTGLRRPTASKLKIFVKFVGKAGSIDRISFMSPNAARISSTQYEMNISKTNRHFAVRVLVAALLTIGSTLRSEDAPVSLKDAFKEHFLVGTAVNRSMVTGTTFRRSAEEAAKDVALVKGHFNQITAENDMKWALIHPREGTNGYEFGPADAFVNFGVSNKMEIAGHTLVWHSQTPNWVFAGTNPPPTNATVAAAANTNAPSTNSAGRGRFGGGFGRYNGPRASREEL